MIRKRRRTYAADYIVLSDGALFRVGLEEVDLAEELVLVVLELSDHDGRVAMLFAMRQDGASRSCRERLPCR